MVARSKALVCGRCLAGVAGSNSTRRTAISLVICVLSGRGLCDELITHPEESYRVW